MNGLILLLIIFFFCSMKNNNALYYDTIHHDLEENGYYPNLSTNHSVRDILNHSAFKGFSQLILPWDNNTDYFDTPLLDVGKLMPFHSNVDPYIVVSSLNHMIGEVNMGKTIFYNFYNEEQKLKDSTKGFTGLFFLRGKLGVPFAIVCPGGGFSYIGSLHEGFPLANEISKKGFNAFVIRYRLGSEQLATEDLAAAIAYIFRNAKTLGVSTEDYLILGGSRSAHGRKYCFKRCLFLWW